MAVCWAMGRAGGECAGCGLAQRGVPGSQRDQAAGQFRDGAAGFAILRQMPFQGGPEGGPLRDAVQCRQILCAQRGNLRVGQDVLQQRIAVRGTALLRIGEFQQLGIEQPVQFLVQGRRHPPRHPMQPGCGAVRSGLCQERRGAVHERHGHTPHQVDGMLIHINWLQVLGTAERSQVDQRVRHQLHAIVSLLDTFKS